MVKLYAGRIDIIKQLLTEEDIGKRTLLEKSLEEIDQNLFKELPENSDDTRNKPQYNPHSNPDNKTDTKNQQTSGNNKSIEAEEGHRIQQLLNTILN